MPTLQEGSLPPPGLTRAMGETWPLCVSAVGICKPLVLLVTAEGPLPTRRQAVLLPPKLLQARPGFPGGWQVKGRGGWLSAQLPLSGTPWSEALGCPELGRWGRPLAGCRPSEWHLPLGEWQPLAGSECPGAWEPRGSCFSLEACPVPPSD